MAIEKINPAPILRITAIRSGIPGDDLVGIEEATRAVIGDHPVRTYPDADSILIARTQTGGCAQDVYGDSRAVVAARRARRKAIQGVADAVAHADQILGRDHPLARYLELLRNACGPAVYRTVDPGKAERAAVAGCDLRRDRAIR